MNKKVVLLLVGVLAALVMITSCRLFSEAATVAGWILPVDADGHFKEDIIYQWEFGSDRYIYALRADGTVEYYAEIYEDAGEEHDGDGVLGEGWVMMNGGYKGTYSWDRDTLLITEVGTQTVVLGEWANVTNQTTWVNPMFFSEHQFGMVYVKSESVDNQWVQASTTATQNTNSSSWTQTLTINEDTSSFMMHILSIGYDATGAQSSGWENEASGTFTVFPEGTKWRNGNTLTVLATITLDKDKFWDNTVANDWDAAWAEDNDQYVDDYDLTHMGDYVIENTSFSSLRTLN